MGLNSGQKSKRQAATGGKKDEIDWENATTLAFILKSNRV